LDGVAVITSPDVSVGALSSGQIQGILAGSIKNWSEVGDPDLPITLLAREPGSAVSEILNERIMRNVRLSGLARLIPTDELMKQEVLSGEGAIGFTMIGSVENGSLAVDGNYARIDTVANQSYPLTSPIYFVSLVEPEGPLREFLAWLQSSEGQIVLSEKYGRVR
jgi:phosphate transport system substrate-binding protein